MTSSPGNASGLGVLWSVRASLGQALTRARRRRALTTRDEFSPPQLRPYPDASEFASPGELTAVVPVNMYWGKERYFELDGFQPAGIPLWLSRFDWVVGFEYGWADTTKLPETVFCEPSYLPRLLAFLKQRWPKVPSAPRLLVASAGPDVLLSWHKKRLLKELGQYFTCIFYEAKDIDVPGVHVMPIGFTEHYLRSAAPHILGLAHGIRREMKSGSDQLSVLAAWGTWWPTLDDVIPDRRAAREFAATSPLVTQRQVSSKEWFDALSQFDFMLCPLGNGVQAPKMMEAILMGCIPIVTRHPIFLELQQRGVPLMVVGEWEEATEARLRESYATLFPSVMDFRKKLLNLDEWWSFNFPCHDHQPARFA